MKNLKLHIRYDGTAYHGWQRQENAYTVQQALEEALYKLTGKQTAVTGCSRTDAGVHARQYVCNFFTESSIPIDRFPLALNAHLPNDIAAFFCEQAAMDFHARFSAKSKKYSYCVLNASFRDPLYRNTAWHYPIKLSVEKMQKATEYFIGRQDFSAFMAAGAQQKETVKEIYSLTVNKNEQLIFIDIHANSYLYNMVRIIAGTLVYVGNGKLCQEEMPNIIASRDRTLAGITAPPQGLSLIEVIY